MSQSSRLSSLIVLLRQRGYRLTPQRVAILRILTTGNDHPTAEQVYDQVRREFPMTSLATIYKTVSMLKSEGELIELDFGDGSSRYDVVRVHSHPHLVCVRCHTILDPEEEEIEQLVGQVAERHGFKLIEDRILIYGLCPRCQQAESS